MCLGSAIIRGTVGSSGAALAPFWPRSWKVQQTCRNYHFESFAGGIDPTENSSTFRSPLSSPAVNEIDKAQRRSCACALESLPVVHKARLVADLTPLVRPCLRAPGRAVAR
jgi:hypothetical protein